MAAAAAVSMMAIGTGVSVYSALQQGAYQQQIAQMNASAMMAQAQAQAGVMEYQAGMAAYEQQVAKNNAIIANRNAGTARQQALFDAGRIRQRNARIAGRQRAVYANSGVQLEGTPSDVMRDSAIQGEMDALLAIYQGELAAGGHEMQRHNFLNEANMRGARSSLLRMQGGIYLSEGTRQAQITAYGGDLARQASYLNAASSLFNGASSAIMSYPMLKG